MQDRMRDDMLNFSHYLKYDEASYLPSTDKICEYIDEDSLPIIPHRIFHAFTCLLDEDYLAAIEYMGNICTLKFLLCKYISFLTVKA
jgi:hypothetical protein